MFNNDTRRKLQNIIDGVVIEKQKDTCTTIRNFLCTGFKTSATVKRDFENKAIDKEKQAAFLKQFAKENNLWLDNLPNNIQYLTRGGEAVVYLAADNKHVIKINDAIYYATWLEYLNNLVIHNLLFPETAYSFIGFTEKENVLYAILKQPFVKTDGLAKIADIKILLTHNGFENALRNDYYHKEFRLLLEDMHDENVIMHSDTLFFIDTVFYIV